MTDSLLAYQNKVYNTYWDHMPVWDVQKSRRPLRQIQQNFPNNDAIVFEDDYPNPNVIAQRPTTRRPPTTTVAIPGMGTPRSPCEEACLVTSEYNPICGTDGLTYTNTGRLNCAIRCGKRNYKLNYFSLSFMYQSLLLILYYMLITKTAKLAERIFAYFQGLTEHILDVVAE